MGSRDEDLLYNVLEGTAEAVLTKLSIKGIEWVANEIQRRASQPVKQLELGGTVGYATSGSKVTITADNIINNRNGGKSGTLMLMLWATDNVYNGGTITGYVFGSKRLDPLDSGYQYTDIKHKVNYVEPPKGDYYVTLTLNEYEDDETWLIYDWRNFGGEFSVS